MHKILLRCIESLFQLKIMQSPIYAVLDYIQQNVIKTIFQILTKMLENLPVLQQRLRPACESMQSDQCLCYLIYGMHRNPTCNLQKYDIL